MLPWPGLACPGHTGCLLPPPAPSSVGTGAKGGRSKPKVNQALKTFDLDSSSQVSAEGILRAWGGAQGMNQRDQGPLFQAAPRPFSLSCSSALLLSGVAELFSSEPKAPSMVHRYHLPGYLCPSALPPGPGHPELTSRQGCIFRATLWASVGQMGTTHP